MTVYNALELLQEQYPNISQRRIITILSGYEKRLIKETRSYSKVVELSADKSQYTFEEIQPGTFAIAFVDYCDINGFRIPENRLGGVSVNTEDNKLTTYYLNKEEPLKSHGIEKLLVKVYYIPEDYDLNEIHTTILRVPIEVEMDFLEFISSKLNPTKDINKLQYEELLWKTLVTQVKKFANTGG